MKNIIIPLVFFLLSVSVKAQNYVYTSVQGSNMISVFSVNSSTGSLNKVEDEPVAGGPASMAISPNKNFLYVSQRSNKTFSSYSIDRTTGALTFIGTVPAIDNPVNISTDNTGRYLFSAYFAASKAAVQLVDSATGVISSVPLVSFTTLGINPHAIHTDPANKFVFIANMTGNRIQQFSFDDNTGVMTPNSPAFIQPVDSIGPRHFVFHGSKNIVYFSNEIGNRVSVYSLNNSTGQLALLQEISTLPAAYSLTNKVADIHITPDNTFLYVSNRGQDAIAAFSINAATGLLTATGYFPTQTSPRAFDIDATGSFLYAAGETSGKLSHYMINNTNGELNLIGTYNLGINPTWVSCVSFDTNITGLIQPALGDENDFRIFQNPFSMKTELQANHCLNDASIGIYNSFGMKVEHNSHLSGTTIKITQKNLPQGIYILRLTEGNKTSTTKFEISY